MNASVLLALAILPWSPQPATVLVRDLPRFQSQIVQKSQVSEQRAPGDPVVVLPATVSGDPATFILVTPSQTVGDDLSWFVMDPGISLLPTDLLVRHDIAVVMASKPGKYRLAAYTAAVVNGKAKTSPVAICTVIVGTPPDPGPGPDPKPDPTPIPIPGQGLRVLVVYESATPGDATKIMGAKVVRDYLNAKCVKGDDGKSPEWRFLDKDVPMDNASAVWKAAMARPRTSLPWVVLSNGTAGYEGPLPGTVDGMMALLKKYGGN